MNNLNKDDEFFVSKIKSMIAAVEKNSYPKFSAFMDMHQILLANDCLSHMAGLKSAFYGGCDTCERKILCIYPEYLSDGDIEWPIVILEFRYNKNYILNHRDFLGALMALQIKREALGDIWVSEAVAQIAVSENLADFIVSNTTKIGSVGVKISISETVHVLSAPKFQELTGTVSSLRIDSVLAVITGNSRAKSASLISSDKVSLNYSAVESNDKIVKPGDIIVVRGYGKHVLTDEIHMTKKCRYHIKINKYI